LHSWRGFPSLRGPHTPQQQEGTRLFEGVPRRLKGNFREPAEREIWKIGRFRTKPACMPPASVRSTRPRERPSRWRRPQRSVDSAVIVLPGTKFLRPFLHRGGRLLAHTGDGRRPSWRPVIGVVLPPLWHQGHKGQPMPHYPRTAAEGLRRSGGRTDGHASNLIRLVRNWGTRLRQNRLRVGAGSVQFSYWGGRRNRRPSCEH
jgi:hypothetical protein